MSSFAIKYPFFVLMICLIVVVVGVTTVIGMPVDLFPQVNIPVVVVATFYSGMPPQQIESDITNSYERFFTLGSGIDHIESRSLPGVSLIKIYFQPGVDGNAAVSNISNLAMANLRRLPPGTLPPVVLKFDASNMPVCLITLKGQGLNETQLKDLAQFSVRNQVANVPGASVPQPYGGRYRQIQVYVDPVKLEAHQMSVMDVVKSLNASNLILPAGDVRIGPKDYNIYANSQVPIVDQINDLPLKTVGNSSVMVGDIGQAKDAGQLQTNIVRVDGQKSVYIPVLKQGGNSNTITIVNGVKQAVAHLLDVPKELKTDVVFDQSVFVKIAVKNVINEGMIGLVLTALMILLFLGNFRATIAVLLSIPISCLATFLILNMGGSSINTMVLGGLALALSRLIDNSVVVLENIFRHMEMGESPVVAAEAGGKEVQLAVLAGTVCTCIVFFPVVLLYGVSKYLFTALALAVVIALFASFIVAMTVVPLFCARFIRIDGAHGSHDDYEEVESSADPNSALNNPRKRNPFSVIVFQFNRAFYALLAWYEGAVWKCLKKPGLVVGACSLIFIVSLAIYPLMGKAFFPRTDPGQFVINVKVPAGTRIELTNEYLAKMEQDIRSIVTPHDLNIIVSNIGITPDLSAIYTSNSGMNTAFIQVSLKEDHKIGSYAYMDRVRAKLAKDFPDVGTYFQAGGLVDSVVNQGKPAPIDIQITGSNLQDDYQLAQETAAKLRKLSSINDVLVPQDLDYPGLELNINREHAALLGVSPKDVVDNVITALTSDGMIAPSFWVDPKSGNSYMLTVQYPEDQIKTLTDFMQIPLRSPDGTKTTPLESLADIKQINTPTEVDHYQLRRLIDIYVMPKTEDLSVANADVNKILSKTRVSDGVIVKEVGAIKDMQSSFSSFGIGLILAIVLVYLILMAQFTSFSDPFVILLAVPPGITGVLVFLWMTGTTVNVMSLMGAVMMTGIAVSNSILIVEFTGTLRAKGMALRQALVEASKARLRPILMTTLATVLGLIPMALALEPGSEQYAPLARAILGGLVVSVVVTVFLVPAAYLLIHHKEESAAPEEI
ncbi:MULTISPECIES: efflux RND transporter permease subunit [Acidobacteriaceae]|uniref:efflux RND transporter permease subunit n=1 Tax=Acidobacteriaceae TaxID=204434 RepID=UPI00131BD119|nr:MULTISPECIES: efflux RND transporter permease subunit [Acidobacteriaceae]MDW5266203.1 efflux RND transporter permease subunit [Edaphobacter sp.]